MRLRLAAWAAPVLGLALPACSGTDSSTSIDVAASRHAFTADEDVSLDGRGSGDMGAISIAHGVGSITFRGSPMDAFLFDSAWKRD